MKRSSTIRNSTTSASLLISLAIGSVFVSGCDELKPPEKKDPLEEELVTPEEKRALEEHGGLYPKG